ncbi:hypothetical protein G7Z17_g10652 [Cylindrodendrum hubeiense]|uniref:Uncharacterized protein n=1 Tax=Cylindrodendrum hubeiense TaxID=595255 RepID=A0A9P5H5J5_9HYPO|nr:hypothetical protein G7Z17_g10652 [Cylindrodendrum hubeiense]
MTSNDKTTESSEVNGSDLDSADEYVQRARIKDFSKPTSAPWAVVISHEDFQKLMKGFYPKDMDDKWVVQTDGPDEQGFYTAKFARSWTSFLIVSLKIQVELGENGEVLSDRSPQIQEVSWELDRKRWGSRPDEPYTDKDAKEIAIALCQGRLGFTLPE